MRGWADRQGFGALPGDRRLGRVKALPLDGLGLRQARRGFGDLLALHARRRRNARYLARSGGAALRIVEQGDSWHHYPLILRDMIDLISDRYAVYSLSAPGNSVAAMAADGELARAVRAERPHLVLLSGGGNDLFALGGLRRMLRPYQAGGPGGGFLDWTAFGRVLSEVIGHIRRLIEDALAAWPETRILVHGYDYPMPRPGGQHLGGLLDAFGIPLDMGARALRLIVDGFNDALDALVSAFQGRAVHIDLRGTIPWRVEQWHDELHPKTPGFKRLAERMIAEIERLAPSTARPGLSLVAAGPPIRDRLGLVEGIGAAR